MFGYFMTRSDPDEAVGMGPAMLGDLVVADHRSGRAVPATEHADGDARAIHLGQGVLDGGRRF
jgi:hypothetical protein